jgi:hypothetical protein
VIEDILQLIGVSLVAGIGITGSYSFVVLGIGRSAAARRSGESVPALAYAALAMVFLLIFAAGVMLALKIMLTKA